jgi:hypothetical protein
MSSDRPRRADREASSAIESGAYPRDVVATIARGFLPLDRTT